MSLPLSQNSNNFSIDRSLIEEISRSILSNLDRDSLLNNIITLIHQIFGFTRVNLIVARGEDNPTLRKIGISPDGLSPETAYSTENDQGPIGRAITQLELIAINNISQENRFPQAKFEKNIQSELVVPLMHGGSFIGVLDLCAENEGVFTPESIQAITHLADNIAIAIRNANLYHSEQIKSLIAERLRDVIGTLSVDVSEQEIIEKIQDEIQFFLPIDVSAVWFIDSTTEESGIGQFISSYRLGSIWCKDPKTSEAFNQYLNNTADTNALVEKFPGNLEAINQHTTVNRNKSADFEPLGALLGYTTNYSALTAPLLNNDLPIGMITCVHHLPDQYDEESVTILQAVANYVSIAIENTRLYSVAHDQAWVSTVLLQIAESTQSITNLDELLETIVTILPGLIGVKACNLFLWDPGVEAFYSKASNGFEAEQTLRLKDWYIPQSSIPAFEKLKDTINPVILDTDPLLAENAAGMFPNHNFEKDLLILFPLPTQNSICGALLIDFSESDLDINSSQYVWDEKYTLIQGAAHQAAIAIENLQLITSQEEEAYKSVALLQVAQAVVSLNQLDEILATIVRITPILAGVKRCIIYLWDGKDQVFRQSQYFGFSKNDLNIMGQVIKANEFPIIEAIHHENRIICHPIGVDGAPISWDEITEDEYHVIENSDSDSGEEISMKLDEKFLSGRERLLIGFPLSVKAENLGVMLIEEEDSSRGQPSFHIREKRIEIVKGITQQAAIAIKNEQLQQEAVKSEQMERELQLARDIQSTFLPRKLPDIPGWDIAARWQPARQVGGDFYDVLALEENKIGVVIADVADKGMPAALFMTLIRTLIRAAAKEKSSPAAVLRQVNELLIPDSKQSMFVTVFYAVISPDSGVVRYANAGHNPPIVKRANTKELVELTRTSIALGIFEDIEVEEREITLNPGDWMLLYTDGITEAFSIRDEMFGVERLNDLVTNHAYASSPDLLDLISNTVNEFIQGTDLSDDMTMSAIYRKPA